MWATSLMRNARLSQHFTKPNGSWCNNSRSCTILNWLTGNGRMVNGCISPSRPTCKANKIILLYMTSYVVQVPPSLHDFYLHWFHAVISHNFPSMLQWKPWNSAYFHFSVQKYVYINGQLIALFIIFFNISHIIFHI